MIYLTFRIIKIQYLCKPNNKKEAVNSIFPTILAMNIYI